MGLGSIPTAAHDDLICERCPIAFRKDYVDRMLDGVGKDALAVAKRGKTVGSRARALTAYMLMGMPGRERRAKPGA
jgi:hypothetical protein